ncbi:MAG: sulfur oxidation c-type cytochrome SoxX [Burkholderiales bacterium]
MTNYKNHLALVFVAAAASLVASAATAQSIDYDAQVDKLMKASFTSKGIATVDRLEQDKTNDECSKALGKPLAPDVANSIKAENLKTVKMPSDGNFIGDWKAGEKLAQNGRGMTWRDKSAAPESNGGNCYNCHQISKSEISFGTIGPSLYQYGKLRGVTDPKSAAAKSVVEYTWGQLYNSKAYNACSRMPRFGHMGMLNEEQLRNLMALLLDPASPANQ